MFLPGVERRQGYVAALAGVPYAGFVFFADVILSLGDPIEDLVAVSAREIPDFVGPHVTAESRLRSERLAAVVTHVVRIVDVHVRVEAHEVQERLLAYRTVQLVFLQFERQIVAFRAAPDAGADVVFECDVVPYVLLA